MLEMDDAARQRSIDWIRSILDSKHLTGTELARSANVAPSTILRLLNDENYRFSPSLSTLAKIAASTGVPLPDALRAGDAGELAGSDDAAEGVHRRFSRAHSSTRLPVRSVRANTLRSMQPSRPVEEAPRPRLLDGDDTAFAFRMPDATLAPLILAGSMLFATAARDPVEGDLALLIGPEARTWIGIVASLDERGIGVTTGIMSNQPEIIGYEDIKDFGIVVVIERGLASRP